MCALSIRFVHFRCAGLRLGTVVAFTSPAVHVFHFACVLVAASLPAQMDCAGRLSFRSSIPWPEEPAFKPGLFESDLTRLGTLSLDKFSMPRPFRRESLIAARRITPSYHRSSRLSYSPSRLDGRTSLPCRKGSPRPRTTSSNVVCQAFSPLQNSPISLLSLGRRHASAPESIF